MIIAIPKFLSGNTLHSLCLYRCLSQKTEHEMWNSLRDLLFSHDLFLNTNVFLLHMHLSLELTNNLTFRLETAIWTVTAELFSWLRPMTLQSSDHSLCLKYYYNNNQWMKKWFIDWPVNTDPVIDLSKYVCLQP